MIAGFAFLAAAQLAAPPSMDVSAEQLSAALGVCRDQISRSAFEGEELATSGWPKAMSQGPDAAGYIMATYRHPTTMLMIGLIHDPARTDECFVMTPLGSSLTPQGAQKQATALFGKSHSNQWQIDTATIRQEAMTGGLRFTFTKKGSK